MNCKAECPDYKSRTHARMRAYTRVASRVEKPPLYTGEEKNDVRASTIFKLSELAYDARVKSPATEFLLHAAISSEKIRRRKGRRGEASLAREMRDGFEAERKYMWRGR